MTTAAYPLTTPRPGRFTALTRTFNAEWTKLHTLRSTWRSVAVAVALSVGLGTALVASQVASWQSMTAQQHRDFDATSHSLIGVLFAAVVLGALAVRSITGEYSSGMIRTTFTARPARRTVLAAKAATVAVFVFPVALLCNLVGFELGQSLLAAKHAQVSLSHPGVIPALILGAVAVSLVAVIGVGLGGIIRRTAPATTALTLIFIGGALFADFVPAGFRQYLPESATQAVMTVHRSAGLLPAAPALGVLAGYAALALGLAAIRIGRRDV
jgi:ABC-type transport system involved in multi-copper enzyme maturation permease subunit